MRVLKGIGLVVFVIIAVVVASFGLLLGLAVLGIADITADRNGEGVWPCQS